MIDDTADDVYEELIIDAESCGWKLCGVSIVEPYRCLYYVIGT